MELGGCSLTDNSIKSRQRQWPTELQLLTVQKCLPSANSDVSPNEELREVGVAQQSSHSCSVVWSAKSVLQTAL